jgi:hypothetical protein
MGERGSRLGPFMGPAVIIGGASDVLEHTAGTAEGFPPTVLWARAFSSVSCSSAGVNRMTKSPGG